MPGTFLNVLHLLIMLSHRGPHTVSNIIIVGQGYHIPEELNNFAKVSCGSGVGIWQADCTAHAPSHCTHRGPAVCMPHFCEKVAPLVLSFLV